MLRQRSGQFRGTNAMGHRLRAEVGLKPPFAVCMIGAVLLACTSAASTTIPPTAEPSIGPTAAATASPAPVPTGPAAFILTVSGDSNVTGSWGKSFGIDCSNPTFDGLDILFFAQSPDTKAVVLITLKQGSIEVSERAGAGSAYTDREFQGSGVAVFDARLGASFDSDLSIVPSPDQKPGILGTITHVAGSIECGNQTPGTSTVVASGSSPEGAFSGPFTAARVTCNSSAQYGASVGVSATINAGTTPTLLIISLPANRNATIFSSTQAPAKQHSYTMDRAGVVSISTTGAHIDADFVEVVASGTTTTPHTIHLAGDVTCGTINAT
jgi:hypothetical protein